MSPEKLLAGKHKIAVDFKYDGGNGRGGLATLLADGKPAASGRIDQTLGKFFSLDASFNVGEATGTPVSEDYRVPFRFTGKLEKVTVTLR